jgi:CubicO group peptidase (beta-lactamase class C family)
MSSGLDFPEEYNPTQIALGRSHTVQMLFTEKNAPGFVLKYPAKYDPGRHWSYSSGTSNLLASLLRSTFDSEKEYLAYAPERLFAKVGMSKTLIETDFEGNASLSTFLR